MNTKHAIYTINIGGVLVTTDVQMHSTKIKEVIK